MQKLLLTFLLLPVILESNIFTKATTQSKLRVSIYYESLCGSSIQFIQQQFKPNWEIFFDYVYFDLVPYGAASQTQKGDDWEFKCQHGPNECHGNIIQACAIDILPGNLKALYAFISCFVNGGYDNSHAQNCTAEVGISSTYPEIQECADGPRGRKLLAALGDRHHSCTPRIPYSPTIIYDNVYNEDVNKKARGNLRYTTCAKLETKPANVCDT